MFTKSVNQDINAFIMIHWLFMSVCAGLLNAVGFIGLGTFATHVTGFGTLFGVHIAEMQFGNALAALAVPLFFLLGSIISGLCVEARVRHGKIPLYDYVMYFCSFLLILAAFLGRRHDTDPNPNHLHLEQNFILLSLIALASGLINAALSYSSSATVRITHLTGVTTDLGRGLAEMISLKTHHIQPTPNDLRVNWLRFLTIVAFVSGGVIGAFLFHSLEFDSLLFPAAYFLYAGTHGRKTRYKMLH